MNNELTNFNGTENNQLQIKSEPTTDVARVVKEVESAIISAKKFPRDESIAYKRIINSCKRKGIADSAMYSYPRGKKLVTGASIRLAEVLAQNYGNIQSGVREIAKMEDSTLVEAYCWDVETNFRDSKIFEVKHFRDTKQGKKKLTDDRDIYEMIANMGARRKRACILAVIPADIVEDAIKQCDKTMAGNSREPLADRVRKMVLAFDDLGVSKPMLELRLRHTTEEINQDELIELTKIFRTIKDGVAKRQDFFEFAKEEIKSDNANSLNNIINSNAIEGEIINEKKKNNDK